MLTLLDLVLKMLLPLVAGIGVAVIFKMIKPPAIASLSRSCGVLTALLLGYFSHFASLNFAFADGENYSQKVMLTLAQTTSQILNPSTAIQWLPIITTTCLAMTLLISQRRSLDKPIDHDPLVQNTSRVKIQSRLRSVFIFGMLAILVAGTITRLLWSTVYFTDRYTLLSQIGLTSIPVIILSWIWLGGFQHSLPSQAFSRWTVASTLLLSVSAMVLMATSGSVTFALLQLPVIAATLVGLTSFNASIIRSPANHDAWLITSGISLPVVLGFFFAEVSWENALLFSLAAAMATWLVPKASNSNFRKIGIAFVVCLPAIATAIWSAIEFSDAVKSPYG